jgi:O-antigen/teichoic acid export membrane protein
MFLTLRRRNLYAGVLAPARPTLKWLLRTAFPAGIANALGAAIARFDAIILSLIAGNVALGLYGGAYRLYEATLFLSWGFGLAVYPMLSRLAPEGSQRLARAFELSSLAITAVLVPLGAVLAFFPETLLTVVYGDEFTGGATAARILGGATVLYGAFIIATLVLTAREEQRVFTWVSAVTLAINIALNIALIPPLSVDGAAIAMTASQALLTGLMVALATRGIGRVSVRRILIAPGAGLLAISAAALLVGDALSGIGVALAVYAAVFFAVEFLYHRDDLDLLIRAASKGSDVLVDAPRSGLAGRVGDAG